MQFDIKIIFSHLWLMKKISLIAAMSENRVIGRNNRLPWKLPADWHNFRKITAGKPFIMGRNSYLAPDKLLSTSLNIVLSHSEVPGLCENCLKAGNWEKAFSLMGDEPEVFILGGQQVFEEAIQFADYMFLTLVHTTIDGDAYFPGFDESEWTLVSNRFNARDSDNPFDYSFLEYERKG